MSLTLAKPGPAVSNSPNHGAPLTSIDQAVETARALAPAIRARAADTEANRIVSPETIAELHASGLFGIVTPKVFGGSELGFEALVRVTVEIARACGSTGWVYGVLAGHSWLVNLFPVAAQRAVFADPDVLIATLFRLGGEAEKVPGGWRITGGEGRFCSGVDHVQWVIVGNPCRHSDGTVESRFLLVPRSEIEIIDDWHTMGMRGTGSRSIRIADAFVPDEFSASSAEMMSGKSPGTALHNGALYRTSFRPTAPFSIVGAPIGMALSAADMVAKAAGKTQASSGDDASRGAFLTRVGAAVTDIQAGLSLVLEDARRLDSSEEYGPLNALESARFGRDWAYAVQKARYAATQLFEVAGGSGIYNGSDIQRAFRDVSSSAQHFAFSQDSAMIGYAREFIAAAQG